MNSLLAIKAPIRMKNILHPKVIKAIPSIMVKIRAPVVNQTKDSVKTSQISSEFMELLVNRALTPPTLIQKNKEVIQLP